MCSMTDRETSGWGSNSAETGSGSRFFGWNGRRYASTTVTLLFGVLTNVRRHGGAGGRISI